MYTKNYDLRAGARNALRGNWLKAVGLLFAHTIIIAAVEEASLYLDIFGVVIIAAVSSAVKLGVIIFCLNLMMGSGFFLDGFRGFNNILKAFWAVFMMGVFLFLWSLLFIIPGIVKMYSYSQTLYIIAENPDMPVMGAIKGSRVMMKGFKMKLFFLHASFIGWAILSILTFGIGFIWLIPYFNVAEAAFYLDVKKNLARD